MRKETLFGWKIVGLFVVAAFVVFRVVLPWYDRTQAAKTTALNQGTTSDQIDWDNGMQAGPASN